MNYARSYRNPQNFSVPWTKRIRTSTTRGLEGGLHWIHLPPANRQQQPCSSTHGLGARASPPRTQAAAPSTATVAWGTARVPPHPKAPHSRWQLLSEKTAISHLLGSLQIKFCNSIRFYLLKERLITKSVRWYHLIFTLNILSFQLVMKKSFASI